MARACTGKTEGRGAAAVTAALAFLAAAMLLCLVYACSGLYPFGEKTLSWGDMDQQVLPLLMELQDILRGDSGFFLNLQNAGGMSFYGVFFFFLASPFSFLALFWEKAQLYLLANLLVLLKLSLAAASGAWFFQREYPSLGRGKHLFFGLSYGLCGYGLLYYQNLVWLDMLCLFPLVMRGFSQLVYRGRYRLFLLALSSALVVNYYLSYMLLLSLVLCGGLFLFFCLPKGERAPAAGKLGACTIVSLLLTAVVWLPSLLQCLRSARMEKTLLDHLRTGGFFTSCLTTLPMLLCTAGAVCLPLLWHAFPATPKRRALLLSLLLTALPLVVEPVNSLWHTGSYQAFPARYGYIPLFLALWYGADVLASLENAPAPCRLQSLWPLLPGAFLLLAAGGGAWLLLFHLEGIDAYTSSLWMDGPSFAALCAVALPAAGAVGSALLLRKHRRLGGRALTGALLLACLVQGIFQAALFLGPPARVPQGEQTLLAAPAIPDEGLYRVKTSHKFCDVNLLGALGYPTLDHYTSFTGDSYLHTVKQLGYSSYWMETSSSGGTALTDILLSNKYVLSSDLRWTPTGSGNLGYLVQTGSLPETLDQRGRFALQDAVYRSLTGEGTDAFRRCRPSRLQDLTWEETDGVVTLTPQGEAAYLRYEITVGERETLYFDAFRDNTVRLKEDINDAFQVTVNGRVVADSYPTQSQNGILKLGNFSHQTVTVEVEVRKPVRLSSFGVCGLPQARLHRFRAALEDTSLGFSQGRITGAVQAGEEQSLFLSLPGDPGLRVTVDGEEVPTRTVLGCFLEIPLALGQHQVEVTLVPQGLRLGLALTAAGAALCLGWRFFSPTRTGESLQRRWCRAAPFLLLAAFTAELILLYLFPMGAWLLLHL